MHALNARRRGLFTPVVLPSDPPAINYVPDDSGGNEPGANKKGEYQAEIPGEEWKGGRKGGSMRDPELPPRSPV